MENGFSSLNCLSVLFCVRRYPEHLRKQSFKECDRKHCQRQSFKKWLHGGVFVAVVVAVCLVVLEFELRTLCLLIQHSTTWAMPPAFFAFIGPSDFIQVASNSNPPISISPTAIIADVNNHAWVSWYSWSQEFSDTQCQSVELGACAYMQTHRSKLSLFFLWYWSLNL
jgi:hypothetical protein